MLNSQLTAAAERSDVTQIVYTTYGGETWIRTIQQDATILIQPGYNDTRVTRALQGQLYLYAGSTQYCNFQAGRYLTSNVNIVLYSHTYYFIEIVSKTKASKSPDLGYPTGGDNPQSIVLSGSASNESYPFTWTANSSESTINWEFEGIQHSPGSSTLSSISVDFLDY